MIHFERRKLFAYYILPRQHEISANRFSQRIRLGVKTDEGMELSDKLGLLKSVKMYTKRTEGE